jgi:pimeloyl-ACP methyl ester carboxylesterase
MRRDVVSPVRPVVVVAVAALVSLGACSDDSSAVDELVPSIDWNRCGALQCGAMEVPRDHFDPGDGETITIAIARRPADDSDRREGAILLNPGGPGAPGQDMVQSLENEFPDSALERFDLVAWDPRGTGESTHVTCADDLDFFFETDKSPDTQAEIDANIEASRRFAESCEETDGDLLPYLSTTQTVEDMDWIRRALGDDGLTYLGFSYGTYLGARYAEAHPDTVRALVLDGPVDPSVPSEDSTVQQSIGFERALAAFFDWCAADTGCAFYAGGDPAGAFVKLMAAIDAEELYAEANGEERGLGPGEADLAVATALYSGELAYNYLAGALAEAATGDASELLMLADLYAGRDPDGTYDGSMAAFYSILCLDSTPSTVDDIEALSARLEREAPFLGKANAWLGLPCAYWPVPPDPKSAPHRIENPSQAGILVTATDGDPATPIEWAEGLAEQLGAPLLVARSDQHTAFTAGDDCVHDAIVSFLVDVDESEPIC